MIAPKLHIEVLRQMRADFSDCIGLKEEVDALDYALSAASTSGAFNASVYKTAEELAAYLESLYEVNDDGYFTGRKWDVAQRAAIAVMGVTPPWIGAKALEVAKRFTQDTETQRRASLQIAVSEAMRQAAIAPPSGEGVCQCAQCRRDRALNRAGSPFVMDPLPEHDASKSNREQGLYRKYDVRRTDGSDAPGGKHHGCEYFVLDTSHDKLASVALTTYAIAAQAEYPDLARDIAERYGLSITTPQPATADAPPAWQNIDNAEAEFLRNLADNGGLAPLVSGMLRHCARLLDRTTPESALTQRFRQAARSLAGLKGEKPTVYAEDIETLVEVLRALETTPPPASQDRGGDELHVFNCRSCPVSIEARWSPPDCPECGNPCELDHSAKPSSIRYWRGHSPQHGVLHIEEYEAPASTPSSAAEPTYQDLIDHVTGAAEQASPCDHSPAVWCLKCNPTGADPLSKPAEQAKPDGPEYFDGCSREGFIGGCERIGCHDDDEAPEPTAMQIEYARGYGDGVKDGQEWLTRGAEQAQAVELPPLPDPAGFLGGKMGPDATGKIRRDIYTSDQMREYANACRLAGGVTVDDGRRLDWLCDNALFLVLSSKVSRGRDPEVIKPTREAIDAAIASGETT